MEPGTMPSRIRPPKRVDQGMVGFPEAVKLVRLVLGLTQHDLGTRLGFSATNAGMAVAEYEHGRRRLSPDRSDAWHAVIQEAIDRAIASQGGRLRAPLGIPNRKPPVRVVRWHKPRRRKKIGPVGHVPVEEGRLP